MVTLLAKIFIQEKNDQTKIREEYGVLCGVVGILFNVLLFAGKFLAGTISHSIAITADAVNNLSDASGSIVTLVGFWRASSWQAQSRIRSIRLGMAGSSISQGWWWQQRFF